jgi:hypothetical protein
MKKQEWDLIKQYIDAKVIYEIENRVEDEEGYHGNADKKEVEQAEQNIDTYLTETFIPFKIRK